MKRMLIVVSVDEETLLDTFDGNQEDFDYQTQAIAELGWASDSGISVGEVVIADVDATSGYSWVAKCAAVNQSIALTWGVVDVQDTCFRNYGVKLTDEQAFEILQIADHRHDANEGINWIVLDVHTQMYLEDKNIKPDKLALVQELMEVRTNWKLKDYTEAYADQWDAVPEDLAKCKERMEEFISHTYECDHIAECIMDEQE